MARFRNLGSVFDGSQSLVFDLVVPRSYELFLADGSRIKCRISCFFFPYCLYESNFSEFMGTVKGTAYRTRQQNKTKQYIGGLSLASNGIFTHFV